MPGKGLGQLMQLLLLGRGSVDGCHACNSRLQHQPNIQHVQGQGIIIIDEGKPQRVIRYAHVFRNEGSRSLPGFQYIPGNKHLEGIPQRAAADIQLRGELRFGGQLLTRLHFVFSNIVDNLFCCLLD